MSEQRFVELFRLPKSICKEVIDEVSPFMNTRKSSKGLSKNLRFLVALRFFAQGSYQRSVGQDFLLSISQSSVSRCVNEIADIFNSHLLAKYVKFPVTSQEVQSTKTQFYEKFRFPGIIGAIDCSHIKIKAPSPNIEHVYVCRKGGHSMNVQVVCDTNLKILDCNARFGGTAHDASIWRASALRVLMQNQYGSGLRNFWLLGDSGYPQLPYLMTPIQGNNNSPADEAYNRQHRKARNCIERCFGVLKSRFRCLLRERVLAYKPLLAGKIINTCIVLHNIMINHGMLVNEDDFIEDGDDPLFVQGEDNGYNIGTISAEGVAARQKVVDDYFRL